MGVLALAVRDPLGPPVQRPALRTNTLRTGPLNLDPAALFDHSFANPALLREALTHRSAAGRGGVGSNERMEFIGDRVLGLLIAEWLAEHFVDEQEGQLGPRLALLVSRPVLAEIAEEIGLGRVLSIAAGEVRAGLRRRATVLSDGLEAALGALYLDGGLVPARRFVRRAWAARMAAQGRPPKDPKTALQEHTLGHGWGLPRYAVVAAEGPPHAPSFHISVCVPGLPSDAPSGAGIGLIGAGIAGSKRLAERAAAADLLARLASAALAPSS